MDVTPPSFSLPPPLSPFSLFLQESQWEEEMIPSFFSSPLFPFFPSPAAQSFEGGGIATMSLSPPPPFPPPPLSFFFLQSAVTKALEYRQAGGRISSLFFFPSFLPLLCADKGNSATERRVSPPPLFLFPLFHGAVLREITLSPPSFFFFFPPPFFRSIASCTTRIDE